MTCKNCIPATETAEEYVEKYELGEDVLFVAGYDDCILGVCMRFGQERIVAYDYDKVIAKLMKDMSFEEAVEYFDYNIVGAWVGDMTPCFIQTKGESDNVEQQSRIPDVLEMPGRRHANNEIKV